MVRSYKNKSKQKTKDHQQSNLWTSPWDLIFKTNKEFIRIKKFQLKKKKKEISALDFYHLIFKENLMFRLHLCTSLHQIPPHFHANTIHMDYWILFKK